MENLKKNCKKKVKGTLHYFFVKKEFLFWTYRNFFQTFLPIYDHLGPKKKNEDFFFLGVRLPTPPHNFFPNQLKLGFKDSEDKNLLHYIFGFYRFCPICLLLCKMLALCQNFEILTPYTNYRPILQKKMG